MASTFTATDGNAYEQQMGRWSQRLAEPFLDFIGFIGAESILDLGCGTGSLTLALARRSATSRICGLDVSADYIDYARRRTSDPQIEFRVGDACALPFPQASFDRVLSLLMLHFVPAAPAAVAEMRRVARPGATVAAAVWDARGGVVAHRIFLDTAEALDPQADALRARSLIRPMTRPKELAAAFQEAGFPLLCCDRLGSPLPDAGLKRPKRRWVAPTLTARRCCPLLAIDCRLGLQKCSRVMRRRFWTMAPRWNSWVGLALDHVELVRDPGRARLEVLAGDGLLEFNDFSCRVRLIALVLLAGCIPVKGAARNVAVRG